MLPELPTLSFAAKVMAGIALLLLDNFGAKCFCPVAEDGDRQERAVIPLFLAGNGACHILDVISDSAESVEHSQVSHAHLRRGCFWRDCYV